MCNDEAWNVVICSMNANIHVVVHKDLHEINLLNVKKGITFSTPYYSVSYPTLPFLAELKQVWQSL
jgi:hypothetical protein